MNKREFLHTLGLAGLGLAVDRLVPARGPLYAGQQGVALKHWAWVPTDIHSSADTWKQRFEVLRQAGISAILPEIYNSRRAFYESKHLPNPKPWLEEILPLAKAQDLEVHAWMWSMPCNIEEVRKEHPDWFVVNRKGESSLEKPAYVDYYRFLCPSHPGVHEFLKTTVGELCSIGALDGVHLDYIRYPDVILPEALQPRYGLNQDREYPEFDYCYCDLCRRDFERETGIDPMTMDEPSENAAWKQFRCDRVTHLVNNTLVPVARAHKKLLSAAVFPNWQNVRQQWAMWRLDAVLPMLYHPFYNKGVDWIREETERGVRSLEHRAPLYSGLLVGRMTPEELTEAIQAAVAGGASGVCLFYAQAMTDPLWQGFRQATRR